MPIMTERRCIPKFMVLYKRTLLLYARDRNVCCLEDVDLIQSTEYLPKSGMTQTLSP